MEYPKKLIEVALPLDDINAAASSEKSIRHGHPSTLHLWWARRPLAVARAVLFAQLVNDPGGKRGYGAYKGQSKEDAYQERERLFDIIRDLVKWENINNEKVLERARIEIKKSWRETCIVTGEDPGKMPPFLDPFAGGGAIPLEAQRLGLEAHASDLNPVAVMINKAMIEIPPKFGGRKPTGPTVPGPKQTKVSQEEWSGVKGLAEDVRRYGHWVREEAIKQIGSLYPEVELPKENGGGKATVIAWLWARTVRCANPACTGIMPLVKSFDLSTKKGKRAWVEPQVNKNVHPNEVTFSVYMGNGHGIEGTVNRQGGQCIFCDSPTPFSYIREEGKQGRIGKQLLAVVAEGKKGRIYLPPSKIMEEVADSAEPFWSPTEKVTTPSHDVDRLPMYGMFTWGDAFSPRQLVALATLSDLVKEARIKVIADAKKSGLVDDGVGLDKGGCGATAYGDAIAVYLAFALDKSTDYGSTICTWISGGQTMRNTFGRQAIPMVWDYAEANLLSSSTGSYSSSIKQVASVVERLPYKILGKADQKDAAENDNLAHIISTDPPYYDNVGYADISDFFYVWLRRSLKEIFPDIFSTMLVPKSQELVAMSHRHGSKKKAEEFFLKGMTKAISHMANNGHTSFPTTIYYAFKQSETKAHGTVSTGWEAFLEAIKQSGFSITGTWPMRTEMANRIVGTGTNALASSIILVCRKRPIDSITISRKQFVRELDSTLPNALEEIIGGTEGISPVAPVDLAQAAIGPGMAVFSKYETVLEADGSPMSIHNALILINRAIDEYFTHAESDMGADTRFCVDWFLQYGFKAGQYGEADVLARAKGTTVGGVAQAGVVESGGGKVRLLRIEEYPKDWDPEKDKRTPVWEACHQLCRALRISETEAGLLLSRMKEKGEPVRQLAYRLYTQCERKGWAEDARVYNELITSWPAILEEARKGKTPGQMKLPGHE